MPAISGGPPPPGSVATVAGSGVQQLLLKLAQLAADLESVSQSLEPAMSQMSQLTSQLQSHMAAKPRDTAAPDYRVRLAQWQSVTDKLLAQTDLCSRNIDSLIPKCSQLMQQINQVRAQLPAKMRAQM